MTDDLKEPGDAAPDHRAACRQVIEPLFDDLLARASAGGWPRDIVFDLLRELTREKAQQSDDREDLPVVSDFPLD